MSKILTVIGATGTQGGSVIACALKQGTWKIRGITRNTNSASAKALTTQGVEMVTADLNDEQSLIKAFQGSHFIYAVTDFFEPFAHSGPTEAIRIESAQGINLARAAAKTPTLEHYIWSTLPNGSRISGGKYKVPHFEAKNRVDDFIKSDPALYAKTTFMWVTFYAGNYLYPMFTPNLMKSSGKYVQLSTAAPTTPYSIIGSPRANVGRFVVAILNQPALTLPGRFVLAKMATMPAVEVLKTWGAVTGKPVEYVKVSLDDFDAVWPMWGLEMGVMLAFWDEYKDKSWSGEDVILQPEELGVKQGELEGLKEAFEGMSWEGVL